MKRISFFFIFSLLFIPTWAQQVKEFNLAGPFAVSVPVGMDSVDVNGKKFEEKSLLDALSLHSRTARV